MFFPFMLSILGESLNKILSSVEMLVIASLRIGTFTVLVDLAKLSIQKSVWMCSSINNEEK